MKETIEIKLLAVYPSLKQREKFLWEGTLTVYLSNFGFELRNIGYRIYPDKKISILPPIRYYHSSEEEKENKRSFSVETIKFKNEHIWDSISESLKKEMLKRYEKKQEEITPS